jgi:CrcB protein
VTIQSILAVGAGGALGAIARYAVYIVAGRLLGPEFPYGTLIVNVVGSFLMGVIIDVMALTWEASLEWRLFLVVGCLGAFTTFSTFSLDFATLYGRGRLDLCALYVSASVILSVGALFLAMFATRSILIPKT